MFTDTDPDVAQITYPRQGLQEQGSAMLSADAFSVCQLRSNDG